MTSEKRTALRNVVILSEEEGRNGHRKRQRRFCLLMTASDIIRRKDRNSNSNYFLSQEHKVNRETGFYLHTERNFLR